MTASDNVVRPPPEEVEHEHNHAHQLCGCCGRHFRQAEVAELESTPGVFVCAGCALSLARQAGPAAALRHVRSLICSVRGRMADGGARPESLTAIPILPSTDLDRTAATYAAAGFTEAERFEGYLLLRHGRVEVHFTLEQDGLTPGRCFLHVRDAAALWKQLDRGGLAGLGPVEDKEYGLREFVLTDPDGNQVRFGSPIP